MYTTKKETKHKNATHALKKQTQTIIRHNGFM